MLHDSEATYLSSPWCHWLLEEPSFFPLLPFSPVFWSLFNIHLLLRAGCTARSHPFECILSLKYSVPMLIHSEQFCLRNPEWIRESAVMKPSGHLKKKNVVSTLCKLVGPILKALLDTTVLDYCLTEAEIVSARLHWCWESYQPVTQSRTFSIALCHGWRLFSFFLWTWFWSCSPC